MSVTPSRLVLPGNSKKRAQSSNKENIVFNAIYSSKGSPIPVDNDFRLQHIGKDHLKGGEEEATLEKEEP